MSVKESRNYVSSQRVDIQDLKALDSSVNFDFASLIKAMQGDVPYILRGFDLDTTTIGSSKDLLQLQVDSAVVWMPGQTAGPFLRVNPGTANEILNSANSKLIGSFANNTTNYVSIQFLRSADDTTSDVVSLWDVDSQSEFTKIIPRGLVIDYRIVVSQSDFGTNSPIAKVTLDVAGNATSIENCKQSLFRLGTGGQSPNINHNFTYSTASEANLTTSSVLSQSPFTGGDWEIKTFKEWMDAVMTKLKQVSGSAFWYTNGSTAIPGLNLLDLFNDANASLLVGKGKFQHLTPGNLTWTSDLYIKSMMSSRSYTIAQGSISLSNEGDVMYVKLVRNNDFQAGNSFTNTSGSPTLITGAINVTGLVAGDWVKFASHPESHWTQVINVSASTVTLAGSYPTPATSEKLLKSTGAYTAQVAAHTAVPQSSDVYWLAKRSSSQSYSLNTVTNVSRTAGVATIAFSGTHSFSAGQSVSILLDTNVDFNSTVEITGIGVNSISFTNVGPDFSSIDTGSVSSTVKIYLRALGEISQGEQIAIDNTVPEGLLAFIGSPNQADSSPLYAAYSSGSLNLPSYNTVSGESLTERLSKVTAMLADNKQESNIVFDLGDITWDGTNITLTSASISIPGTSVGANPISIADVTSTALPTNSCVYIDINRTTAVGSYTTAISTISTLTPSQQRMVIIRNVGGNLVVRA